MEVQSAQVHLTQFGNPIILENSQLEEDGQDDDSKEKVVWSPLIVFFSFYKFRVPRSIVQQLVKVRDPILLKFRVLGIRVCRINLKKLIKR